MSSSLSLSLQHQSKRRRYLIGVSGGCDSVVLLRSLVDAGYRQLVVVHVNHRLRGPASAADARFVRRLAGACGLDFEGYAVDVRRRAAKERRSLEATARACRYECFAEASKKHRCPRIFLAHHADDQVETVLMNLCRGAGPRGLGGMREESTHRVGGRELTVIRPLLDVWRSELLARAGEEGWDYRDDASNLDEAFLRNRVRHSLMPVLGDVFRRDVRPMIVRLAKQQQALQDWIDEETGDWAGVEALPVKALRARSLAWQQAVARRWLRERGVPDVGYELVGDVLGLVEVGERRAKVNLPGNRHVRRRSGRIFVE